MNEILKLSIVKDECGIYEASATLNLPELCITRSKADKSDLEYEVRRAFEELVGEIVSKQLQDEF